MSPSTIQPESEVGHFTPFALEDARLGRGMGKQGKGDAINASIAKPNALGNLPVELLNESFSYLNPIDLLAVTMSSKPLCHILTDPKSNFVWKRARHNLNLNESVPDPTPNWTEPAYAHFLFKPKRCTVCRIVRN